MTRTLTKREELRWSILQAGRAQSTATIMLHQAIADRLGLNPTDHKCADLLTQHGPLSAGELAELTGLTTGAITGVIDRLEKAGYVKRQADPQDRRRVIVQTIPQQLRKIGRLFESLATSMYELCGNYSSQELTTILDFMKRSGEIAHQEMIKLRARD